MCMCVTSSLSPLLTTIQGQLSYTSDEHDFPQRLCSLQVASDHIKPFLFTSFYYSHFSLGLFASPLLLSLIRLSSEHVQLFSLSVCRLWSYSLLKSHISYPLRLNISSYVLFADHQCKHFKHPSNVVSDYKFTRFQG